MMPLPKIRHYHRRRRPAVRQMEWRSFYTDPETGQTRRKTIAGTRRKPRRRVNPAGQGRRGKD